MRSYRDLRFSHGESSVADPPQLPLRTSQEATPQRRGVPEDDTVSLSYACGHRTPSYSSHVSDPETPTGRLGSNPNGTSDVDDGVLPPLEAVGRLGSNPNGASDGRQARSTSNAATLSDVRLNSTPIRWIGSLEVRYLSA